MGEGRSCAASVWRERPRAEGRWPGLLRWWACYCGFAWVYNKHPLPRWLFLFSLKLSFPNSKRINSQIFSWFYLLAVFLLFPDQFVNPLIPAPIYRYSFFVVLGFFEQSNPQYMWLPGSWPELLKAQSLACKTVFSWRQQLLLSFLYSVSLWVRNTPFRLLS